MVKAPCIGGPPARPRSHEDARCCYEFPHVKTKSGLLLKHFHFTSIHPIPVSELQNMGVLTPSLFSFCLQSFEGDRCNIASLVCYL